MSGNLAHWLAFATEVLREELLGHGVEMQSILRPGEAVALVLVEDVLHRQARLPHGLDDLLAFGLLDARVIRALGHKQGPSDLPREMQRRPRLQERLLCIRVADAVAENADQRLPVGRDAT